MAEKVTGGDKKPKKTKKQDGPGMGHNLVDIKKKAKPALDEILKKFDDMESDMGSYRAEIKDLYEKHANVLGCPRKVLRKLVKQVRDAQKDEAELAEMEPDERDQLETLQASLDNTPFGDYFRNKLDAAPAPAKTK